MKNQKQKTTIAILVSLVVIIVLIIKGIYFPIKDAGTQTRAQNDYFPTDDWRTSTPEEQGIDSGKLANMLQRIENFSGIRSILIIRHGHLVLECYRPPYDKSIGINVMSVTKSFMSALTGIAIRENHIAGVDQKVSDLLPEYFTTAEPRKKEITLEQLLTMSAGFPSVEPYDDMFEWPRSKDWVEHVINLPLESEPGSNFTYSSGLTHLMSAIITKTSGMSTLEFAEKHLFDPIGIKLKSWAQDPNGIYNGGAYLTITPRDMAKFGYLYLNEGIWDGKEIIPKEWIKSSTESHINTNRDLPVDKYGYWWWLNKDYYLASGWGGQYIFVSPKLDLVAVFTSTDARHPLEIYQNYVSKSVKSDTPLKPNPDDVERMNTAIERIANPKIESSKPEPGLIEKINGKTFKLNQNEVGLDSFSLSFYDSHCTFNYKQVNKNGQVLESEFPVGINGEYKTSMIKYHPTYFEVDMVQFPNYKPSKMDELFINNKLFLPVDEPNAPNDYSAAFAGNWIDESTFQLISISPIESPYKSLIIFEFDENKVNLVLASASFEFRADVEGVMVYD